MRTITLELLRHGPANNQLLSPLTPYLALCENHAAVTLHVPFEHNQFLYRLRSLTYKLKEESRVFELQDTARVIGEILAEIPGLAAESNKRGGDESGSKDQEGGHLTHLRLIISASELALLPFELALSPNGLPGAGQHLLLQPQTPICLTREIRRVRGERVEWFKKPKILFVAAAPPEVGSIPLDAHLLVLRRVIAPWVYYYDPADPEQQRARVEEHLHVLPGASIKAIEDACASGGYTHVHILAHGVEDKGEYDTRFALALHDNRDPRQMEKVSGSRLATALRASTRRDAAGLSMPAVVTLASCDSAGVGSVAGAGASIAHALHEAGIPMVVAGQFPLSFEGSVRLAECLYEGLLWGKDPRPLLYDLRRRLSSQFQQNHDWASLTAYVSLPPDIEQQLPGMQIEQAKYSINAAMNHADEATKRLYDSWKTGTDEQENTDALKTLIEKSRHKIEEANDHLEVLLKRIPAKGALINGLLGSTAKRHAEMLYTASSNPLLDDDPETRDIFMGEHDALLLKARDYYWDSFQLQRSESWAVVQYLALTVLMQRSDRFKNSASLPREEDAGRLPGGDEREEKQDPGALWTMGHLLALYELNGKEDKRRVWAHGSLIELNLLALVMGRGGGRPKQREAEERALRYAGALVEIAGRDSFDVYSTWRQIHRYLNWFQFITREFPPAALALAGKVFDRLPEDAEKKWS